MISQLEDELVAQSTELHGCFRVDDLSLAYFNPEHPLRATVSGQVEKVVAQHGDQLKARQLILLITEENNPE